MRQRYGRILLGALIVALIPFSATAQQENVPAQEPRELVEAFHATLLDVMKRADILGYGGRREQLGPALDQVYNLRLMIHWLVGRAIWKELDEAGKNRLLEAFKSMTLATYASRFDGYSGQRFVTIEEREGLRNDFLVRTELVDTDGDSISLDYLVRQHNGEWKVIDVFFKRISEMATRKSEYTSVIRRAGIDGLIELLETKVQEIEDEEAAS